MNRYILVYICCLTFSAAKTMQKQCAIIDWKTTPIEQITEQFWNDLDVHFEQMPHNDLGIKTRNSPTFHLIAQHMKSADNQDRQKAQEIVTLLLPAPANIRMQLDKEHVTHKNSGQGARNKFLAGFGASLALGIIGAESKNNSKIWYGIAGIGLLYLAWFGKQYYDNQSQATRYKAWHSEFDKLKTVLKEYHDQIQK